ncbi:MAG: winged helix-turn-helix transcriptional regulator [Mailhella sp.]|nr:winged helix-turn-helix transcriptional regulator [Mailhella sp.]
MDRAAVFKALGDENRYAIIRLLLLHGFCVRALARHLDISEAAVSQHIKILREAGLLYGKKKGHFMHYAVDREALRSLGEELVLLAGQVHAGGASDKFGSPIRISRPADHGTTQNDIENQAPANLKEAPQPSEERHGNEKRYDPA